MSDLALLFNLNPKLYDRIQKRVDCSSRICNRKRLFVLIFSDYLWLSTGIRFCLNHIFSLDQQSTNISSKFRSVKIFKDWDSEIVLQFTPPKKQFCMLSHSPTTLDRDINWQNHMSHIYSPKKLVFESLNIVYFLD